MADFLAFGVALFEALLAFPTAIVTQVFFKSSSPKTFKENIAFRLVRAFTSNVPARGIQSMSPSLEDTYNKWATRTNQKPNVVTLPEGGKAFWIGDQNARNVVLFFHGGGYATSGTDGHFDLSRDALAHAHSYGASVAALHVQYTLAPGARYPTQLKEAVAAFSYLLKDHGTSPEHIILAGDSAGGHLALSLLSHLKHPHPTISAIELPSKLAGVLMLSPWVTFDQTALGYKANSGKDVLDARALKSWSDAFMGGAKVDPYNHPLSADPQWWDGVPAERLCMTAGKDELFHDDICAFAEKVKVHNPKTELVVAQGEPHDGPIFASIGFDYPLSRGLYLKWVGELAT